MSHKARLRDRLIRLSHRVGVGRLTVATQRHRGHRPLGRVLTFHEVEADEVEPFDDLLELVATEFEPVALRRLVDARTGEATADDLGAASVALTFDDGYASWMERVVPLLRRHEVPATFFVTSGFVDAEIAADQRAFARRNLDIGPTRSLDWSAVRRLAEDPLFTVGGHTRSHADLGDLSPAEARVEVVDDRERLGDRLGTPPSLFAYPYGAPWNVTAVAERAVAEAGYDAGFTFTPGLNTTGTPRYHLHRDGCTPDAAPAVVRARLAGAYDPLKRSVDLVKRAWR